VEFLLSPSGTISFLEVNTRLQVEHTVTEETSGIDLVVEQLRVADGLPLSITDTPMPRGQAFEFRINAEDVGRGFLPTPGPVRVFEPPSGPGVRVDTGVLSGSTVPGSFDSLMAKLIVTGATRAQAINRARRALKEFRIEGVASVLPFHLAVMAQADFTEADEFKVHTRWIETDFANTLAAAVRSEPLASDIALVRTAVEIDGRRMALGLPAELLRGLQSVAGGAAVHLAAPAAAGADPALVAAPITGTLQSWKVADGDTVGQGDTLATMEAMKMEMQVTAHRAGRITLKADQGTHLTAGASVAEIR
jgi:acetyl-CoA/propionyl-CoA carboxylase biotin carboxyl carrier protein